MRAAVVQAAPGDGQAIRPAQATAPAGRNPEEIVATSPDGTQTLISTTRRLLGPELEAIRVFGLALADRQGTVQRPLVDEPTVVWAGFSPDAKRIVYTTHEDEICVVELNSGSRQCFPGLSHHVGWSPDSAAVAYERSTGPDETKIFVTRLDTQQTIQVTREAGFHSRPSFSPDGRTIVFVASPTGLASLCSVDLESGRVAQLTNRGLQPGPGLRDPVPLPEGAEGLVWSPEGRVAWQGDGGLWVLDPASPAAKPVARIRGRIRSFNGSRLLVETPTGPRPVDVVED